MNNPLISVIIPTIARGHLRRSVNSILDCNYSNLEVIIVSDKSREQDILKLLEGIEGYNLLINEDTKAPAKAKNRGLEIAKGKYVTFLDDDDIAYPTKFFALSEYLEGHSDVFGAFGQYDVYNINGELKNTKCGGFKTVCFETLVNSNYIASGSIMLRNTKDVRFPEDVPYGWGEDYKLWLELLGKKYKIDFISQVVYGWTMGSGFTKKFDKEGIDWRQLTENIKQEMKEKYG